jgi:TPR repeat protein
VKTVAAMFYEKGYGVDMDEALALKLYREAWEAGNPLGGYRLMLCHQKGWSGLPINRQRATELARELSIKYEFMPAAVELLNDVESEEADESVAMAASLRRMILAAARRGDPSAQFRMAWVHRRDGDWEMALRFYELAAHNDHFTAGSNLLNRFTFPIGRDRPNLLRAPYNQLHGMARKNYEEGGQDDGTHRLAGRDYRDRISGEKAMFARAEQIFVNQIKAGKLSMHFELGHLYCGNFEGKHPNMHRPELGLAHLLGNANIGANAPSMLAEVYAGEISKDVPVDLPKAYASMARANEVSPNKWPRSKVEKLVARMDFDSLAEAEKLISDGFPHELKHRNEAIDMLIEYGQWGEGRKRR